MRVQTKDFFIPSTDLKLDGLFSVRDYVDTYFSKSISSPHRIVRFVVTNSDETGYHCEIDLMLREEGDPMPPGDVFSFKKREYENTNAFTAVLLIPTGIGAEIGGHCGDGNATARLIAAACDTLITHPNVVNASDINEMTESTLYVEGSVITRLFLGTVGLQKTRSNRILMLMDSHEEKYFNNEIINAVSAARATIGLSCDVYEMKDMARLTSQYSTSGRAVGEIAGIEKIFSVIERFKDNYDAIGLSTLIDVPEHFHKTYFAGDTMVNPWGGVEAMLTHSIAEIFNIPCAHSPMMPGSEVKNLDHGIVDPRKASETSSTAYLHSILKGLHRSPRIVAPDKGITLEHISCLVIPDGCIGVPTLACLENDIPVIAVKENKNNMRNDLRKLPFKKDKLFIVESYLEAAGVMAALKAGVSIDSLKRPISYTTVLEK